MGLRINSSSQSDNLLRPSNTGTKSDIEFGQTFTQTQKLQTKELQDFLKRLEAKGQQLAQTLSLRELKDFKDMVKSFLKSTFGQSRKIQEESLWDFRGRPKVMAKITQIDRALEELGTKVLEDQAKPLEILGKIDEIRGLIIDLFG